MKNLFRGILAVLIVISIIPFNTIEVKATTDYTYYPDSSDVDKHMISTGVVGDTWANVMGAAGTGGINDGLGSGWSYAGDFNGEDEWNSIATTAIGFKVASFPDGDLTSAKIRLKVESISNTDSDYDSDTFGIYQGQPASPPTIANTDWNEALGADLLTNTTAFSSFVDEEWIEFAVDSGELDYLTPDGNGYIWVYLQMTKIANNTRPDIPASFHACAQSVTFYDYSDGDSSNKAQLVLTMQGEPSVTTDAASDITTTTATLNGTLDGLGNETSVNVFFGWRRDTGGIYEYYTAPVAKTTTGAFNTTLTGLTPGATYYYAAFVSNATTNWYGDETSFTMDDDLAVTTNDASYITTGTAVLNGNLTNLGNHTSVEVGFEYGNTTGMTNSIEAFQSPLITTSTFSIPAGMFNGNETIYFRAYASADGTTVYGENKTFVTLPSGPVNNLTVVTDAATGLGDTNATLNGNLTALGNYVPTVGFRYGEFLGFWQEYIVGSQSATGTFSYNLTGLRAGTTYYFQAIAKDAQTGNYTPREGSILSFTTTGTKTPSTTMTVTTGLGYPLGDTQVRFTGSLDEMGTNLRVYVGFDWGLTTAYGNTYTSPIVRTSEGGFDYILSGLTAGQTIHFRAGAMSDTGDIAWGADQTVVVGQYVPPGSPTPTVTPPSGTGTPTPIGPITLPGSWNTTLGRYILLVVLLVSVPLLLMYILGGTLGRGLSGLVDSVIFTAWVIQGWIDLWILVTVLIVAGFIVWKTILSPRGA